MELGTLYEQLGEKDKAIQQYKKMLEYDPASGPAANNLAWHLASQEGGDLGEALRLAMVAKNAAPADPYVADTLGWVHYQRHSYQLAFNQFQQAAELQPTNPSILYHLALALNQMGEKDEAKKKLEKSLTLDPKFPEAQQARDLLKSLAENS